MITVEVKGYWPASVLDVKPGYDEDTYYVFIAPYGQTKRTECVGFATRKELARCIEW